MKESTRNACGCLMCLGPTVGLVITFAVLVSLGQYFAMVSAGISALAMVVGAMGLRMYSKQADLAPDFLAELDARPYADANGLCFRISSVVNKGNLEMRVDYQNRYDQPCEGKLIFQPHGFIRKGRPDFSLTIDCGAGEYGIARIAWPVSNRYASRLLNISIYADVRYPKAPKSPLRFRPGRPNGSKMLLKVRLPDHFNEVPETSEGAVTFQTVWTLEGQLAKGFPVQVADS